MERNNNWPRFGEGRVLWSEHWTNGGTGVTKLNGNDLQTAEAAIKELGDADLYIENGALHDRRKVLPDRRPEGLSPFWKIFRRLSGRGEF